MHNTRRRIPYILAIVSIGPEAANNLARGDYVIGGVGLLLIVCNLIALRYVSSTPQWLEAVLLAADGIMSALTAFGYMQAGSKGVHVVWFVAAIVFFMAASLVGRRHILNKRLTEVPDLAGDANASLANETVDSQQR